ncbi:MAG: GyrI-like domain-containing protein [Actinomycetales bacterium]|nr:GyrI-like domain-containing protein [Actinomycetales bacterium]
MDTEISTEPARLVALVRRRVPAAELVSFYDSVYTDVIAAITAAGTGPVGPALAWMHGADDPSADPVDVAAGFDVRGIASGPLAGEVEAVEIPGGTAVVGVHVGGYDSLVRTWEALVERLRAEGLEARGDTVEEYLTEPTPDGDPDLNRTRLVLYAR